MLTLNSSIKKALDCGEERFIRKLFTGSMPGKFNRGTIDKSDSTMFKIYKVSVPLKDCSLTETNEVKFKSCTIEEIIPSKSVSNYGNWTN